MLNMDAATTARNSLKQAVADHKRCLESTTQLSTELYELRQSSSHGLVEDIERFVNRMKNTPADFGVAIEAFKLERRTFDGLVTRVDSELRDTNLKGGAGAGAGIAAGTATVFLGPTAAMAVATTFGTASTGTAIASLTGAAATNAALAWLGGGALAVGGGGMSAGTALLGLAGPVGWGLAALAAAGGAAYVAYANSKTVEEANNLRLEVEAGIRSLKVDAASIREMLSLTRTHVDGLTKLFHALRQDAPADYRDYTPPQKEKLGAVINHVRALAQLLNRKVQERASA